MFGVISGGGVRTCLESSAEVRLERVWVISGGGVRTVFGIINTGGARPCLGSSTRMQLDVSIKRGSGRGIKGRKRSPNV